LRVRGDVAPLKDLEVLMKERGLIFVVSAPSGAGKTSLCRKITEVVPNLQHSVSYTTRPPREGEVDGKSYFFVDNAKFQQMVERKEFIEWAEVHGNLYGTSREVLMDLIDRGIDVILDVDSQGALQFKKRHKEGVFIYVLPPSFEDLKNRLKERQTESHEEIVRRLKKAKEEIWNYREYYYLIINDDLKKAFRELEAIIVSERIRMKRMNLGWIEENFIKCKEAF
jgi:guanylate kinase